MKLLANVLNLKVRRPDLWELPLTCENTTTLVPYLDIINEILESFIAKKKGFAFTMKTKELLEKGERHSLLDPVRDVQDWSNDFIKSRTINVASLAWDQISSWLD